MTTFIDRLIIECSELKDKMNKLEDFIDNNPKFGEVSDIQQILLVNQFNAMQLYFFALEYRINDLKNGG
jgi:hypothetical protein